jgi:ribosomal protein S18 acetylase RimI-like enzyme
LLRLGGSDITDRGDCVVVSSPGSPTFWWGNFLLLRPGAGVDTAEQWVTRFQTELPGATHRAFGLDDPTAPRQAFAGLATLGFDVNLSAVLTASSLVAARNATTAAQCRPLAGDRDWDQHVLLNRRVYPGSGSAQELAFVRDRAASRRRLVEGGAGVWLGAFVDGRLVAQLGVLKAGGGLGRYQDVETHPDFRRQGLAGALVLMGGAMMVDHFGVRTLVIVADPEGEAIRLYRSLGFTESERVLEASLAPGEATQTLDR